MNRPQRRPNRPHSPSVPRRAPSASRSGGSILSKDPYGLLWFGILFLAVLIAKWWYVSPSNPEDNNCVGCVVAVVWIITMLVYSIMTFFTIYWGQKFEKGVTYIFFISLMCLICALIDYKLVDFVVAKLFYGGSLTWQEAQADYLIDEFIPHSIALALVVAVFYSMIRIMVAKDLAEKNLVYTFGSIVILTTIPLMYLGIMLY